MSISLICKNFNPYLANTDLHTDLTDLANTDPTDIDPEINTDLASPNRTNNPDNTDFANIDPHTDLTDLANTDLTDPEPDFNTYLASLFRSNNLDITDLTNTGPMDTDSANTYSTLNSADSDNAVQRPIKTVTGEIAPSVIQQSLHIYSKRMGKAENSDSAQWLFDILRTKSEREFELNKDIIEKRTNLKPNIFQIIAKLQGEGFRTTNEPEALQKILESGGEALNLNYLKLAKIFSKEHGTTREYEEYKAELKKIWVPLNKDNEEFSSIGKSPSEKFKEFGSLIYKAIDDLPDQLYRAATKCDAYIAMKEYEEQNGNPQLNAKQIESFYDKYREINTYLASLNCTNNLDNTDFANKDPHTDLTDLANTDPIDTEPDFNTYLASPFCTDITDIANTDSTDTDPANTYSTLSSADSDNAVQQPANTVTGEIGQSAIQQPFKEQINNKKRKVEHYDSGTPQMGANLKENIFQIIAKLQADGFRTTKKREALQKILESSENELNLSYSKLDKLFSKEFDTSEYEEYNVELKKILISCHKGDNEEFTWKTAGKVSPEKFKEIESLIYKAIDYLSHTGFRAKKKRDAFREIKKYLAANGRSEFNAKQIESIFDRRPRWQTQVNRCQKLEKILLPKKERRQHRKINTDLASPNRTNNLDNTDPHTDPTDTDPDINTYLASPFGTKNPDITDLTNTDPMDTDPNTNLMDTDSANTYSTFNSADRDNAVQQPTNTVREIVQSAMQQLLKERINNKKKRKAEHSDSATPQMQPWFFSIWRTMSNREDSGEFTKKVEEVSFKKIKEFDSLIYKAIDDLSNKGYRAKIKWDAYREIMKCVENDGRPTSIREIELFFDTRNTEHCKELEKILVQWQKRDNGEFQWKKVEKFKECDPLIYKAIDDLSNKGYRVKIKRDAYREIMKCVENDGRPTSLREIELFFDKRHTERCKELEKILLPEKERRLYRTNKKTKNHASL